MTMAAEVANTPYYVLLNDDDGRIGPEVTQLNAKADCSLVYGFSDKHPYDTFCENSQQTLKPYPLVKGYLRNQIAETDDCLKLLVLDAAGPSESVLNAATMEAVLEAQDKKAIYVTAAYRLIFDEEAGAYNVHKATDL